MECVLYLARLVQLQIQVPAASLLLILFAGTLTSPQLQATNDFDMIQFEDTGGGMIQFGDIGGMEIASFDATPDVETDEELAAIGPETKADLENLSINDLEQVASDEMSQVEQAAGMPSTDNLETMSLDELEDTAVSEGASEEDEGLEDFAVDDSDEYDDDMGDGMGGFSDDMTSELITAISGGSIGILSMGAMIVAKIFDFKREQLMQMQQMGMQGLDTMRSGGIGGMLEMGVRMGMGGMGGMGDMGGMDEPMRHAGQEDIMRESHYGDSSDISRPVRDVDASRTSSATRRAPR